MDPSKLESRRLKDRIDALCAKAIATPEDSTEFLAVMDELRAAMREHTKYMRKMVNNAPKENRRK